MSRLRRSALGVGLVLVLVLAVVVIMSSCASKTTAEKVVGEPNIIRLTLAPDPVWDWLTDQGIRQEMEQAAGIRVIDSSTWDEFGIFAGGHADIISAASYEVPLLEKETGRKTVTFGKYNGDRGIIVSRADKPYKTLADLKGKKVSVFSAVSMTILWGAYVKQMHNLDFRVGGGDFDLIVSDIQQQEALILNGEVEAGLVVPDFATKGLRTGELKILYDGKTSMDIYGEIVAPGTTEHPMINVFLAGKDWYEARPKEAAFFLKLWERGIQEWKANKNKIIETYPQHFSVTDPTDVAWLQDYMSKKDWFVSSIYIDQPWIDAEMKVYPFLKQQGFMAQDAVIPEFAPTSPTSPGS